MNINTFVELMKIYPLCEALETLGFDKKCSDFFILLVKNGCPASAILKTIKSVQIDPDTEDDA